MEAATAEANVCRAGEGHKVTDVTKVNVDGVLFRLKQLNTLAYKGVMCPAEHHKHMLAWFCSRWHLLRAAEKVPADQLFNRRSRVQAADF